VIERLDKAADGQGLPLAIDHADSVQRMCSDCRDRSEKAIYTMSPDPLARGRRWISGLAMSTIVIVWFSIVYVAVHPLTDAPVGDSWVYEHAVTHFNRTKTIQFAGFTEAIPVAQVFYGVAWSRVFGQTSRSLDISTALLGIVGSILFYGLARRCGADAWISAVATALIMCNPCYLFLSFSFMTEVPFLAALLACYLAFAYANAGPRRKWLWLAGGAAVTAFAIRPFAAATIAGEMVALLAVSSYQAGTRWSSKIVTVVPLIGALIACAAFWIWFTVLHPMPWKLAYDEYRLRNYFTLVPLRVYLAGGVLAPAIYLGIVLSPLGILHAIQQWRQSIVISGLVLAGSIIILRVGHEPVSDLERIACFGGSYSALVLSGTPRHDFSTGLAWMLLITGAVGFAGICNAWRHAILYSNCVLLAVLIASAIYWVAIPFLWFFADRYYLMLVPAACLLLAVAPLPRGHFVIAAAGLMTAVLAFVSAGGLVSYHRTMQQIVMQSEALLRQGIPRAQIDAGYSLNGRDLYVYPAKGIDSARAEPLIPLIVGSPVLLYVISTSTLADSLIWREFSGCGPFGFGHRPLFVLKTKALSH